MPGRTITTKPAFGPLLPQKQKPAVVDPVAEAMRRAEFFPQRPSGKFEFAKREFNLTGKELAQFRRDVGSAFREAATRVISSPDWFQLSPEAQRELLGRAHRLAFEQAKIMHIKRLREPERAKQAEQSRLDDKAWEEKFKATGPALQ